MSKFADMSDPKLIAAERKQWRAEHGRKRGPSDNQLIEWRKAWWKAYHVSMRKAWLDEHPGERALPEHFCDLDYPAPGFNRWATKGAALDG